MTRILRPVPASEWRTPSQAQPKNRFGHEPREVCFRVTARLDDGHVMWRGYFKDRDDFDAFLWAIAIGNLPYDRYVQRLPTPWWPGLDPGVMYQFATLRFVTALSASNQTDTVPLDWNSGSNFIDAIASGGSGAVMCQKAGSVVGGGGGAWSRTPNVALTGGGSATFFQNAGGAGVTTSTGGAAVNGNPGNDAWYNGTTLAGAAVGAKGGLGGTNVATALLAGVAGGAAASGIGTSKTSGGASGSADTSSGPFFSASGGGGAGGPSANGNAGTASPPGGGTAGGAGDGGSGGAAGAAGGATPGGNGTEYDATHGSGGGGGGKNTTGVSLGAGGNYGGGSGACGTQNAGTHTSAAGGPPLIYMNYTPVSGGFNLPMMGF